MLTMTVDVMQHHIYNGQRNACKSCPVALALADATGDEWSVTLAHAYDESDVTWRLDDTAVQFIWDFDHNDTTPAPVTISLTRA